MIRPKMTGLFLELSEFGLLAIQASRHTAPLTIEALHEGPVLSAPELKDFVKGLTGSGIGQFSGAYCSFYPPGRFVHRAELDNPMKGRDDPNYFTTLLRDKFHVDVNEQTVVVINPYDGSAFGTPPLPKQVLFCGAPTTAIEKTQDLLIEALVYPVQFEIATISGLGACMSYLSFEKAKDATLVLEVSSEGILSFILKGHTIDTVRSLSHGLNAMLPEFQKQIGLADAGAARAILLSGDFDHATIAPLLLAPLVKELQSFVSFYELQFSTNIRHILLSALPAGLDWLAVYVNHALGLTPLPIQYAPWLQSMGITLGANINPADLNHRWLNLISLMVHFKPEEGA